MRFNLTYSRKVGFNDTLALFPALLRPDGQVASVAERACVLNSREALPFTYSKGLVDGFASICHSRVMLPYTMDDECRYGSRG